MYSMVHQNLIYLFNKNFERLGVVQVNLGVDVEVEVALLIHADLNCGRPRSIFRDGLPVQDLDGIVPDSGVKVIFMCMAVKGFISIVHSLPFHNVLPLGKLIHDFVVVFITRVNDEVDLREEICEK